MYFPEVLRLLRLAKVSFQGIPGCFAFSSVLVVGLLRLAVRRLAK